jgi:hypothetical protein
MQLERMYKSSAYNSFACVRACVCVPMRVCVFQAILVFKLMVFGCHNFLELLHILVVSTLK